MLQPVGSIDLIPKVLSFTFHINYGAAFGSMQNMRWVLVGVTSVVIVVFAWAAFSGRVKGKLMLTAVSLIIAGGLGNLCDRIFRGGGVVDFIYFEPIDFPIFNVADCCVTVGCALVILFLLFSKENKKKGGAQ